MRRVRIGSILLNKTRKMHRVVRHVSYYKNGDLHCVGLAIKHCSWTKRCYTIMNYNDLIWHGYVLLEGANYVFNTQMDKTIEYCLKHDNKEDQKLTCCDVEGVP